MAKETKTSKNIEKKKKESKPATQTKETGKPPDCQLLALPFCTITMYEYHNLRTVHIYLYSLTLFDILLFCIVNVRKWYMGIQWNLSDPITYGT